MPSISDTISVAVVTGGHSFDVPAFHRLFRRLEGIDPYIQHMDDFASSPRETRDAYDAVLFYCMLREGPTDEGLPWYAGKPKEALSHLGDTPQGIILLHHAIVAYPDWPEWHVISGLPGPNQDYAFGQRLHIAVAQPDHPITAGLRDWDMEDETYRMAEPGEGCEVLLTTDHERSMRALAWTRHYKNARVFCLQSGHDARTWVVPQFAEVLRRGILWAAHQI